jgi:hypothetical protein
MRKLKIIGGGLAAVFVIVTAVGFMLPSEMAVERSVVVDASPQEIYPLISDFERGWSQWNPFTEPGMEFTYEGPESGVGAQQYWVEGDNDGTMTITKADPERGVEFDLVMMQESFRLTGSLLCEQADAGTKLTWTDKMDLGSNPYRRYLGLFFEPAIGEEFEKGLTDLKQVAESQTPELASR